MAQNQGKTGSGGFKPPGRPKSPAPSSEAPTPTKPGGDPVNDLFETIQIARGKNRTSASEPDDHDYSIMEKQAGVMESFLSPRVWVFFLIGAAIVFVGLSGIRLFKSAKLDPEIAALNSDGTVSTPGEQSPDQSSNNTTETAVSSKAAAPAEAKPVDRPKIQPERPKIISKRPNLRTTPPTFTGGPIDEETKKDKIKKKKDAARDDNEPTDEPTDERRENYNDEPPPPEKDDQQNSDQPTDEQEQTDKQAPSDNGGDNP